MSLTKHELKDISVDAEAATGAAAAETQIGTDIPDGKTRYVWKIEIDNPNAAVDQVTIYTGEAASKTRNTEKVYDIPLNDTYLAGGSVEDPLLIIRPDTTQLVTQGNQIYLKHGTAACNVMIEYYDL